MYFVYIIYSPTADKYFAGDTNDVPERLKLHNSFKKLKSITKAPADWQVKLIYKCSSKKEAASLASVIQKKKSRNFTEEVIANPHLLNDLLIGKE